MPYTRRAYRPLGEPDDVFLTPGLLYTPFDQVPQPHHHRKRHTGWVDWCPFCVELVTWMKERFTFHSDPYNYSKRSLSGYSRRVSRRQNLGRVAQRVASVHTDNAPLS